MAARVGFEPVAFRTEGTELITESPCPTKSSALAVQVSYVCPRLLCAVYYCRYNYICDTYAQNQSQVVKFGFKILSKNHMRGIFPIDTLLQILLLVYLFYMKN